MGGGDVRTSETLGPSVLQTLRSAAAWIADELGKARELTAVCVDVTGGVCGWLSAPNASPAIVLAALQQQSTSAGSGAMGEPTGPTATFGMLGDAPLGPGSDRSIEALAPFDASARSGLYKLTKQATGETATARKQRLAVLSVPDAAVRILLDELDRLRIDVEAVLSLWHATAAAWDPGRAGRESADAGVSSNGQASVADSAPPVTATVLVEPTGRLVWSWSVAGDLLAAGSMRLRVQQRTHSGTDQSGTGGDQRVPKMADPAAIGPLPSFDTGVVISESVGEGAATPGTDGATGTRAARRIRQADPVTPTGAIDESVVGCSAEQVGRLVMDWLAWSAQLGVTPDRVVCIGVETVTMTATGEQSSLAASISRAWPGATMDAVTHHDPIGATLTRLRTLHGLGVAQRGVQVTGGETVKALNNPQAGMVSLARRAGRVDKMLYRWAALGIALGAAAVFFFAHRLDRATRGASDKLAQMKIERIELLKSVEEIVPGISTRGSTALDELQGKLVQAKDEREKLRREPAILPEVLRVMTALNSDPDPERPELFTKLHVQQFELSSLIPGSLTMMVPYNDRVDRDIPVDLWKELVKLPGVMNWSSGDWQGPQVGDRRKYIFEGRWPERPLAGTPGGKP